MVKRLTSVGSRLKFAGVEVRLGDADESGVGEVQLGENELVAFYVGETLEDEALIVLAKPAGGRFLTLQSVNNNGLEVNELFLYF